MSMLPAWALSRLGRWTAVQVGRTSRHARPGGSPGEPLGGSAGPHARLPWGLELGLTPWGPACLGGAHHRGSLHLCMCTVRGWI